MLGFIFTIIILKSVLTINDSAITKRDKKIIEENKKKSEEYVARAKAEAEEYAERYIRVWEDMGLKPR